MPESDALAWTSFAVGSGGLIGLGCCLVYAICDAETWAPLWVERAAVSVALAAARARLAAVEALLALLLLLSAPKGAAR